MMMCFLAWTVAMALGGLEVAGEGFLEVKVEDVETSLLQELAGSIHPSAIRNYVTAFEAQLQPTFVALPREGGALSHAASRYLLHRYFAERHGWLIRGLEPHGEEAAANMSLTSLLRMKDWVPSYLQSFLEKLLGRNSLTLRELGILAGTLEDFIHKEERASLQHSYEALWWSTHIPITAAQVELVAKVYTMSYMLGSNLTATSPKRVERLQQLFRQKVKIWNETEVWLTQLQEELLPTSSDAADTINTAEATAIGIYNFSVVENFIGEVSGRYGEFNARECTRLKNDLVGLESTKKGRVRLADFYKQALFRSFEFNENIDYLRAIGALDESDPTTPLIIVPNYVASRPNCLSTSGFYMVCCRNECDDLMRSLEQHIAAPEASPAAILDVIEGLSTSTDLAPRNFSVKMRALLERVAAGHGGTVPLHGRLFAQWLHHAFPRECPYPNEAGTATPLTPDEWMQDTGRHDAMASEAVMMAHVRNDTCRFAPAGTDCGPSAGGATELPWTETEELLVRREPQRPASTRSWLRDLVLLVGVCSAASVLMWLSGTVHARTTSVGKSGRCAA